MQIIVNDTLKSFVRSAHAERRQANSEMPHGLITMRLSKLPTLSSVVSVSADPNIQTSFALTDPFTN